MNPEEVQVEVRGFWDGLGVHPETGMPLHLPMGVNSLGHGPVSDADAEYWICWCGEKCPLHSALVQAWMTGLAGLGRGAASE